MARQRRPKPPDRPSSPRHRQRKQPSDQTSQEAKRRTLHDLSREFLTQEQMVQLAQDETSTLDARIVVLIRASLLDNFLENAIELNFVSINRTRFDAIFRNTNAPLSSFSAKIAVAHALGIFGDEFRSQLDRIKTIRNVFAHTMLPLSFDDDLVLDECMK